ncbi:CoA transferase [Roseivivax sediminis]|uniref:CoA-transferase family III n=1 Tax=Roseivivax sediminis TaxID=936889 RepID=A0A1I1SRR3_9RHOB|nr:CoA transferase [Roseivivax sediminis]SFD47438.1 CoA-transferase family III [Roseivivax sediminis]
MTAPDGLTGRVLEALGLSPSGIEVAGDGALPSAFRTTDLLAASQAALGAALRDLVGGTAPVRVDQRLASLWAARSIQPEGWALPPVWDPLAGDYATRGGGWIRLHTNAPHHRDAALRALGVAAERNAVAGAVADWDADALETAVVAEGGAAAAMRSAAEWAAHPQGAAVTAEPLVAFEGAAHPPPTLGPEARPLAGLKVLDLTRVLAGPVGTRALAGYGARVLRIDPPGFDEANVVPDVTLGKACARLDLATTEDRALFERRLAEADLLVHGYRPGALDGLGYGAETRAALNPALREVTLCAYGWTGPWTGRRGFDSLVQMSSGIAEAGMGWAGADRPTPLPVQALDHATGYLIAAAALKLLNGRARVARLSLARTAEQLKAHRQDDPGTLGTAPEPGDLASAQEYTAWGPARRLRPALEMDGIPMRWSRPAEPLGASAPDWPNAA